MTDAALCGDATPDCPGQRPDGGKLLSEPTGHPAAGHPDDGISQQQADAEAVKRSQGLVEACRELSRSAGKHALHAAIPRLCARICPAHTAQLLEVSLDGAAFVLASHDPALPQIAIAGYAPEAAQVHPAVETYLRDLLSDPAAQPVSSAGGDVAIISIPRAKGLRLLLVAQREPARTFSRAELSELEIFAFMAASALARADLDVELQVSQASENALLDAVQDAVIALDERGTIRALSAPAATLMGLRRKDAVGKRLRDLPGMVALAVALSATDRCPTVVQLPSGKARLRLRRCEGGVAVTLNGAPVPSRAAKPEEARYQIDDLVGESPLIRRARETAQRVADLSLPVLITGETGTGKEILAQAIHNASARAGEPFIGVNVSAIPAQLLESELFGYEAGAFTGAATQGRPGKFELAQNGTLLLDEIGEMPLDLQAKLLRVLEEKAIQRLGGGGPKAFIARLIASTNRDLEREVAAGRFRLDLLHRLRVVHVDLPPLRERMGDVRLLVEAQLVAHGKRLRRTIRIAPHVLAAFERYPWPGNVRELVNTLEGEIGLLAPGKQELDTVPDAIERSLRCLTPSGGLSLESAERRACERALEKAHGNVAIAAQLLGVVKATLYAKIRRYGLEPQRAERARDAAAGTQ